MTRSDDHRGDPGSPTRAWLRPALLLVTGGVLLWAVLAAIGLLLTGAALLHPLLATDAEVSRWAAGERDAELNGITHVGSSLSDTPVAIAVTVVAVAVLLWRRRRHDAVLVVVAILGELFVFVLVTATVHRARPPVPHLDPAPPTSSFPSGHTGAAVALYVCLALLLLRTPPGSRPPTPAGRVAARIVAVLFCLVPLAVAVSRVYRGMHYPSDVVAGALGGGTWLILTLTVLGRRRAVQWQAGPRDGGDAAAEREERAGRGARALRDGPRDGVLPGRLLQHRPGGPGQPHGVRGGDGGVPGAPAPGGQ